MSPLTRRQVRWATVLLYAGLVAVALTASLMWAGRSVGGYFLGFSVVLASLAIVKPIGLALAARGAPIGDGIDERVWQLVTDPILAAHNGNRRRFDASATHLADGGRPRGTPDAATPLAAGRSPRARGAPHPGGG